MTLVPKPKYVAPFTASFQNVGQSTEVLKLTWTYPLGVFGEKSFLVGTECFLESPVNVTQVPDEQLLASMSMAAILAGEAIPGTKEHLQALTNQEEENFQTIIGTVRLKPTNILAPFINPEPVSDLSVGPEGTVFDYTFQKGTGSNIKVVRTDGWTASQYGNRIDSVDHMVYVVPGAVHKEFAFKKSQLGAADSANRTAVIDWIATRRFWV